MKQKLKCWKKLGKKPIWIKKNKSLEIFQDTSWRNSNANVILRDKNKKSYESLLGKYTQVEFFNKKSQAIKFANKYMKENDKC